jgi:hypothetical protein
MAVSSGFRKSGQFRDQLLAVPWLRQLFAGLSPRRPWSAPGLVHVGFVVDKVALRQVIVLLLLFPLSVSFHRRSILIHYRGINNRPVGGPLVSRQCR